MLFVIIIIIIIIFFIFIRTYDLWADTVSLQYQKLPSRNRCILHFAWWTTNTHTCVPQMCTRWNVVNYRVKRATVSARIHMQIRAAAMFVYVFEYVSMCVTNILLYGGVSRSLFHMPLTMYVNVRVYQHWILFVYSVYVCWRSLECVCIDVIVVVVIVQYIPAAG